MENGETPEGTISAVVPTKPSGTRKHRPEHICPADKFIIQLARSIMESEPHISRSDAVPIAFRDGGIPSGNGHYLKCRCEQRTSQFSDPNRSNDPAVWLCGNSYEAVVDRILRKLRKQT